MDRRVTPSKRVTSPTWRTAPPCKQALSFKFFLQLLCISLVPMIFPYFAQILPAECSPQKSLILLEILPAEFIQA